MNITVLNQNFSPIGVIDTFKSMIWTDRYQEAGDYELSGLADSQMLSLLTSGNYISIPQSEHLMVVEKIQLTTDIENGIQFKSSGRSVESFLDRRIIWDQTQLSGNIQNGIKKLLNENAISPSDSKRRLANIRFVDSTDPNIISNSIRAQFTGDNLYEVLVEICNKTNVGFKMVLNNSGNGFDFSLYYGVDRSYDQNSNPFIVFSPNFDNLISSEYIYNASPFKNIAEIAGEGEGSERTKTIYGDTSASGLNRRELFVDARDLSSNKGTEEEIPQAEYIAQLQERGAEKLTDTKIIESFDGEIDTTLSFKFGVDFFLGDVVQIENELGMKTKSRVSEMTYSESSEGYKEYPTFAAIV